MANINDIKKTPASSLDQVMLDLCYSVQAKRARTVIDHILEHGIITNEELSNIYRYNHPPRAIKDVRDNGVPLITHNVVSPKTGRRMGAYTFDDVSKIVHGRIGGRKAFPKRLKQALITMHGSRDAISHTLLPESCLQIDHRVPYEISGDDGSFDPSLFMLLDASSNRQKSWACEHCPNFSGRRSPEFCSSCFWAFPEQYMHIAGESYRRVDLTWVGQETLFYDRLVQQALNQGIPLADLIKRKLSE
ncbi:MAG: hypothetical protein AB7D19_08665 [Acetobacter sp.]|uniref:hypothetical protein n=1 Tax=Acetobacter sp. TaxID=440 RepID=UPI003D01F7EB